MIFFESRYFDINKRMLNFVGLWPYQNRQAKIFKCSVIIFFICIFITPHVLSLSKHLSVDTNKTLQSITNILYLMLILSKLLGTVISEKKIKRIFENITQNWQMVDKAEINILIDHSESGRFLTILYISYMFSALLGFITTPMLPSTLDKFFPLNVSRPKIFILDGEYPMDKYKNYKTVYVFESWSCIITVIVFSAIDAAYVVCVQQCIAMVNIVRWRLAVVNEYLQKPLPSDGYKKATVHRLIIRTINFHQKSITFVNDLESSYSGTFLVAVGINVCILSVGAVLVLINLHVPLELFRHSLIMLGLMIHMFFLSWNGQQLIDATTGLLEDMYDNHWYLFSLRTQKLLQIMMIWSQEPCQLTAGGIYVMNIENFGTLVKTTLSYITVFASFV